MRWPTPRHRWALQSQWVRLPPRPVMAKTNVFNHGKLHVCRKMCSTCIYGKHSPVDGKRRDGMEKAAIEDGGCIPCHHTIRRHGQEAVCRGFFNAAKAEHPAFEAAERLDLLELVDETPLL
jgi:hypothetical protein